MAASGCFKSVGKSVDAIPTHIDHGLALYNGQPRAQSWLPAIHAVGVFSPQWSLENRPMVVLSKPANGSRPRPGCSTSLAPDPHLRMPIPSLTLRHFENSQNVEMRGLTQIVGSLDDSVEGLLKPRGELKLRPAVEIIGAPRENPTDRKSPIQIEAFLRTSLDPDPSKYRIPRIGACHVIVCDLVANPQSPRHVPFDPKSRQTTIIKN